MPSYYPPAASHGIVQSSNFGPALHRLVRQVFSARDARRFHISTGLGKGLRVNLGPRFEMDYASGSYGFESNRRSPSTFARVQFSMMVGAHIGVLSLVSTRLVSIQGVVFAFEADPANVTRVEEHARGSDLSQIHVVPCAVWSSLGRLRFQRAIAQSSLNQGAVATDQARTTANTIDVEAMAFDDFSKRNALPDLIKIDVEGAEGAVLRGSERIFGAKTFADLRSAPRTCLGRDVKIAARLNYSFEWLVVPLTFLAIYSQNA